MRYLFFCVGGVGGKLMFATKNSCILALLLTTRRKKPKGWAKEIKIDK